MCFQHIQLDSTLYGELFSFAPLRFVVQLDTTIGIEGKKVVYCCDNIASRLTNHYGITLTYSNARISHLSE
jgi:hypothetical protein